MERSLESSDLKLVRNYFQCLEWQSMFFLFGLNRLLASRMRWPVRQRNLYLPVCLLFVFSCLKDSWITKNCLEP